MQREVVEKFNRDVEWFILFIHTNLFGKFNDYINYSLFKPSYLVYYSMTLIATNVILLYLPFVYTFRFDLLLHHSPRHSRLFTLCHSHEWLEAGQEVWGHPDGGLLLLHDLGVSLRDQCFRLRSSSRM